MKRIYTDAAREIIALGLEAWGDLPATQEIFADPTELLDDLEQDAVDALAYVLKNSAFGVEE